jgi:antitoxin (DNA-binding transcriptional repressor) of toxin-antitoxin stability system
MREPQPGRQYEDTTLLESALDLYIQTVAEGNTVPLTKDGELVAVIVSPEVAEAGLRALGRKS